MSESKFSYLISFFRSIFRSLIDEIQCQSHNEERDVPVLVGRQ